MRSSQVILSIQRELLSSFSESQTKRIICIIQKYIEGLYSETPDRKKEIGNEEILTLFITSKRVEGCSSRTLTYYEQTLKSMLKNIKKTVFNISTDDIRTYLNRYQSKDYSVNKVTIDNVRRVLSSFFSWLESEDYILKSPVRRIHKIRTEKKIKETFTDEFLEQLRDHCVTERDLALVDILASTGMRVGELVRLNKSDIDFEKRECIVTGKGDKQRRVYFDAKTKIHLKIYLDNRKDDNEALFVSLLKPYSRLKISGVEIRLRKMGAELNLQNVHPHKFRRTLATKAIDKGMPIEQVQQLLGHQSIDTTLQYAMVNQNNVKESHRKFIS